MFLTRLELTQFRNFAAQELAFDRPFTVLQGPNGAGKTNFLDAVCYLATCKSHKSQTDAHSVSREVPSSALAFFDIRGRVRDAAGHEQLLRVFYGPGQTNGKARKILEADGLRRRAMDMMGRLRVILFIPQDTRLLSEGPGVRRRALDITLCQIDRAYFGALLQYQRVMRERNALLKRLRQEGRSPADGRLVQDTAYWDASLVGHGAQVMQARARWLRLLATRAQPFHDRMTGGREVLGLAYRPSVRAADAQAEDLGEVSRADWETAFARRLQESVATDLARATTGAGPHRDNVEFRSNDLLLGEYGSRGQQRTAIVAYRLAEVAGIAERCREAPLLLLDDVMSELDPTRQATVVEAVPKTSQVIMTTTAWDQFPRDFLAEAACWKVRGGRLQPV